MRMTMAIHLATTSHSPPRSANRLHRIRSTSDVTALISVPNGRKSASTPCTDRVASVPNAKSDRARPYTFVHGTYCLAFCIGNRRTAGVA